MRQYTSKYDDLLKQAKGSAKIWIPQLCQALREENSNLSNEDIRDRVVKVVSLYGKEVQLMMLFHKSLKILRG
jgi:hypothetical protein